MITQTNRELLNSDPSAITLLLIIVDHYGYEVLEWDLETLKIEVQEDFGVELGNASLNKISAAIKVMTTDEFYTQLPSFIEISNALASGYGANVFDIAELEEVAWAMLVASLLWPEETEFSEEIKGYVKFLMQSTGLSKVPAALKVMVGVDYLQSVESLSQDPIMYQSTNKVQDAYAESINKFVKSAVKEMLSEIVSADLQTAKSMKTNSDVLVSLKAVLGIEA